MLSIGQARPEKLRRGDRLAALAWGGFGRLFSLLGPRFTFWFFRRFFRRFAVQSSNVSVIRRNIDLAYADAPVEERQNILDGVVDAIPLALAELMLQNYWRQRGAALTDHNLDAEWLRPYAENDKPALFLLGHFSGWEPNIMTLSRHLQQVHAIYAPPKNPLLERFFATRRLAQGSTWTMLPRDLKGLQSRLKRVFADGGSLLYVLDAPLPGPMLPFMGLKSPTTLRPFQVAAESGAPIIPLKMGRKSNGIGFWIEAQDPMFAADTSHAAVIDLATRMNQHYSDWIRENPQDWYWTGQFFQPNRLWLRREEARNRRRAAKAE